MKQGLSTRVRATYQQLTRFFGSEIWESHLDELPPGRARLYRAARISFCTIKGLFFGDELQVRAAALTYFTVLSLVPLLAFAFALLKGFGAYDALIRQTIRPYVLSHLSGNEALSKAFEQILAFVDRTGVTSLGFIGLVTLLYAATRLLRNIEGALNQLWSASSARDALQQLRDYVAIIVVTPLCLVAGAGLTTAGQGIELLRAAGKTLGISALLDQAIGVLGPLAVLVLGLFFLYKVLPHTPVRVSSALIGACVGAVLWYVVLIVHVRFQVGVAQYNALYSSFGAVPIFLAWLQISWLVVLVGAQVAATHQNDRSLAQRARMAQADAAQKEAVCLSATLRIATAFCHGQTPPSLGALSAELDAPEALLRELLSQAVAAGLLVTAGEPTDPTYVLARAPELISVKDVLDALRRAPDARTRANGRLMGVNGGGALLWLELDQWLARAPANGSLRELVEREDAGDAGISATRMTPVARPLPSDAGEAAV